MKKLSTIFFLFVFSYAHAQTTLINPSGDGGFETGNSFALNGWTAVIAGQTNQWFCGTGATGYTGTRCAHVGTAAGNNNYNINIDGTNHL